MIKILKYVGFISSGIISYMLMTTLCVSIFDYMLAFAMTLVLQASSFYFFDKAIKEKDSYKKTLSSALAIMLFLISIIGTISFQFGIQNNAKNEMIINSDNYKLAQNAQKRKADLVKSKANEIEIYKNNLDQQLLDIESSISEYKRLEKKQNTLYTTRISQLNNKKTELRADFTAFVQKANKDLEQLSVQANKPIELSNIELNSTKGYLPLIETLEKWLNLNQDMLTLIFQSTIACIFELTAIALHLEDTQRLISKKAKNLRVADFEGVKPNPTKKYKVRLNPTKANLTNKLTPKPITTTTAKIGFVAENYKEPAKNDNVPTEDDIQRYIEVMENPNNLGYCKGYKKISEETGFKQEKCRTIKGILERKGIIETNGTKTKIK